jgi:serine/threonine protein kinase
MIISAIQGSSEPVVRQPIPFGKYVLLERISVGGMAEVFKAKAFGVEGFEKILAIKRILPSMAEDADFIEMFIDEAKICGQLNHANICQIFELGRVQDAHFIAMEYVWGKDLLQMQNRLRKTRSTMRPEMAAFIAAKMCEGLDYAHKKKDAAGRALGIIHRDISPQNILVSYEGEVKIIDFGIAKAATRSSRTQAGVLKGKFGYMSPEQVRGLPLDRRSDIFAIGTILYELLTADRLFFGESDFETLEKVRNVDVKPPSAVNPVVPKALEKIILRALAKDVEDRYQWGSEMQEALNTYLLSQEPVFTGKQLSTWMREQFASEMKRERLVLDEQQQISKSRVGVPPAAPPAALQAPMPVRGKNAATAPARAVLDDLSIDVVDPKSGEDAFAEKTTVSDPAFDSAREPSGGSPLGELSTRILESSQPPPLPQLPSQPALGAVSLDPTQDASGPQLLGVQTVVFDGNGAPSSATAAGFGPGDSIPPSVSGSTPHYGQLVPPAFAPPRSTLWKDILIGIGVAAAVVGAVLGARTYLGKQTQPSTLVVVCPSSSGELLIDGAARGRLDTGVPLTLKDLPAGEHTVVVRGTEGGEFRQTVTLAAGDVSVVSASPGGSAASAAVGTGRLRLNLHTGGVEIYVDGAQLADGAGKNPISLRADVAHEIRVTKPKMNEAKLSVTLKAGEEQTRDVTLELSTGKITIASAPAGAEVTVNGKRVGLSPTTASDVDSSRPARVTVKLAGYASVTRSVSFEHGLEQSLELRLTASKDDSSSQEPEASSGDKPRKDRDRDKDKERDKETAAKDRTPKPTDRPKDKGGERPPEKAGANVWKGDDLAPVDLTSPGKANNDPGYLVANTQPWAKVWIDGKDTGKTTPIAPRSKIPLKPGKHTVTFVANGKKYSFDINVRSDEDVRLIKQLTDPTP